MTHIVLVQSGPAFRPTRTVYVTNPYSYSMLYTLGLRMHHVVVTYDYR